jgi:hypothetical protein
VLDGITEVGFRIEKKRKNSIMAIKKNNIQAKGIDKNYCLLSKEILENILSLT